ncbi:SPOC like C-terminal domain-containing protein, partial [Sporodiniella umbellata]
DLVSILLAGTEETRNSVAESSPGQYEHILEACPLQQPNLELLREMKKVTCSQDPKTKADMLDAVIVAAQVIIEHCKKLKYEKSIAIFTDAKDAINWEDFEAVSGALKQNDISLLITGIDADMTGHAVENNKYWRSLTEETNEGDISSIEERLHEIQRPRGKEVKAIPSFRGFFYIGEPAHEACLAVHVHMYLRVKCLTSPLTPHKHSAVSEGPTFSVISETEHHILTPENPDCFETKVDKDDLEKAYRFGKDRVKVSAEESEFAKPNTKKGLYLLETVDKDSVPRYYLKGSPYVLVAGTHRTENSGKAVASFAQALYETDRVAIVKYVYKDGGSPKLGVLLPLFDGPCRLLIFVEIPFANDISPSPETKLPERTEDSDTSKSLVKELIQSMDLNKLNEGNTEYLDVQNTHNPFYWRMSEFIKGRALDPNCSLPDLPNDFDEQLSVHPSLLKSLDEVTQKMSDHFKIEEIEQKKEPAKEEEIQRLVPMEDVLFNNKMDKTARSSNLSQTEISENEPIEDFNYLMSNSSIENIDLVIDCLKAMRAATISKGHGAEIFNNILHDIKEHYQRNSDTTTYKELWELLKSINITLVTCEDTKEDTVQQLGLSDAKNFFAENTNTQDLATSNDDDLLDDSLDMDELVSHIEDLLSNESMN